jgi:hypothetical protein
MFQSCSSTKVDQEAPWEQRKIVYHVMYSRMYHVRCLVRGPLLVQCLAFTLPGL